MEHQWKIGNGRKDRFEYLLFCDLWIGPWLAIRFITWFSLLLSLKKVHDGLLDFFVAWNGNPFTMEYFYHGWRCKFTNFVGKKPINKYSWNLFPWYLNLKAYFITRKRDHVNYVFIVLWLCSQLSCSNFKYFVNYKLNTDISRDEEYTKNFLFYISIVGQVSNVIMNAMNMFCRCGGYVHAGFLSLSLR